MIAKSACLFATTVGVAVLLSACSSGDAAPPPAVTVSATSSSSAPGASAASSPSTSAAPVKVDPVDAAFKAKVDALCQRWLADPNRSKAPFYMGNPLSLTAAQLPEAGSWWDSLAVNHELVGSMSQLVAPAKGTDSWSSLLSDFKAFQDRMTASIAAAKASDLSGWSTQVSATESAKEAIRSDLTRGGFSFNDPCQIVFARDASAGV
jgi:hypothetical protein